MPPARSMGPKIDSYEKPRRQPEVAWISIDERWPPSSVPVLVLLRNGAHEVLNRWNNEWWPGGIPCDSAVAWVHLPRPPRMTLVPIRSTASLRRSHARKRGRGGRA